ncbi:Sulfatase [Candidatus Sulfopaludibacter sp. SbA6]|nr:Sulfatase [Candidatus Sulfopaludibacter sp. SbA6]
MTRRGFLGSVAAAAGSRLTGAETKTPNIVFILCDDLGYGDLGCYGSRIETPNLNGLASEGVRFTNFCSADPVCSPSRAALLTGRYPTRVGVPRVLFPQDQDGLNLDETTIANVLKTCGYRTMCTGKWHLGRPVQYLPTSRGFDEYFGIPYSNDMTPRVLLHNTEVIEETANLETLTQRYTEQARKFIAESKASPFFLYMPHTFPHIPLAASPRFRGKSKEGLYGDVVQEIDWSVGEVLQSLKQNGLDRNTLVMFSSDNGPWYQGSPGKLRGRKNTTYEGGVREPFIARWTGRIPAGRVSNALASMMDVFPTVTKLCGGAMPAKPLDGIDIWPLLHGDRQRIERPPLLYFDNWDLQCARWMDWKLHIARHNTAAYTPAPPGGRHSYLLPKPELYNLASDPDESYDVAPQNPEVVEQIQAKIGALIQDFPEPVRQAYAEAKARAVDPTMPIGAFPQPIKQ